jgi:hypothetical protein
LQILPGLAESKQNVNSIVWLVTLTASIC